MAKKTPTKPKRQTIKQIIAEAKKSRLPSARNTLCEGCFGPRNTLTVKPHLEKMWSRDQIQSNEGDAFVKVPCFYCSEIRKLSLSKFSKDVFNTDFEDFSNFVLLKDDKYNALIGIEKIFTEKELFDNGN